MKTLHPTFPCSAKSDHSKVFVTVLSSKTKSNRSRTGKQTLSPARKFQKAKKRAGKTNLKAMAKAAQKKNDEKDVHEKHKEEEESKAANFGECPYCDPNFASVPGIEQALMGYDVPMGNPNPGISVLHRMNSQKLI